MRTTYRLIDDSDHLRIFQMIFVVLFSFGIMQLLTNVYEAANATTFFYATGLAVVLLGFRLFFMGDELNQYLLFRKTLSHEGVNPCTLVVVHYPFLLAQAMSYFWVCLHFRGAATPGGSIFTKPFIGAYCLLLFVNGLWLLFILMGKMRYVRQNWKTVLFVKSPHEMIWLANNWIIGLTVWYLYNRTPDDSRFILILFFVNSFIDLWTTAEQYVPPKKQS